MQSGKLKVLIVDDEVFNLDILQTDMEDAGFEVIRAEDGRRALEELKRHPDVGIIVLDRMMPNMDGIRVTKELKSNPIYKNIPIIMQTAAGQSNQIKEGLGAGVYYYLTKPYNEDLLLCIVRTALREAAAFKDIQSCLTVQKSMCGLMRKGFFRFRTLPDVSNLAYHVASACPNPDGVVYGLIELMTNAVEHGNLNISYNDKLEMIMEDRWQEEVERRLMLPENVSKFAFLTFESDEESITITIQDQGRGFNWKSYLDFDPIRMSTDPHGRGIAITRVTSFPQMEFRNGGSEVVCRLENKQAL